MACDAAHRCAQASLRETPGRPARASSPPRVQASSGCGGARARAGGLRPAASGAGRGADQGESRRDLRPSTRRRACVLEAGRSPRARGARPTASRPGGLRPLVLFPHCPIRPWGDSPSSLSCPSCSRSRSTRTCSIRLSTCSTVSRDHRTRWPGSTCRHSASVHSGSSSSCRIVAEEQKLKGVTECSWLSKTRRVPGDRQALFALRSFQLGSCILVLVLVGS